MTLTRLTILSLAGVTTTAFGVYTLTPFPLMPMHAMHMAPLSVPAVVDPFQAVEATPEEPVFPIRVAEVAPRPTALPVSAPALRDGLTSAQPSAVVLPAEQAAVALPQQQAPSAAPLVAAPHQVPAGQFDEAAMRRSLERRVGSGTATEPDIKLLVAICRHQRDADCVGRATSMLTRRD
ncbi:hypothetical protein [Polyangium fumosum]|uniref:Uncharacterized protein n=1 Tax=Polyangium fumosum TaxID=889272 RepID=A0A4U1IIL4_9BACT|nr:hypothetical protein [Polyangium fumosum]TKC93704.1 hypothetical protein E8A74_49010 [Polyangium fumosum]